MPHSGKSLLGALSAPVYWLYRLWCRSLRYTEINRAAIENTTDQGRPVVLSLWHDELFPLIYLKRRLNIIALVSQSDDFLIGQGCDTGAGSVHVHTLVDQGVGDVSTVQRGQHVGTARLDLHQFGGGGHGLGGDHAGVSRLQTRGVAQGCGDDPGNQFAVGGHVNSSVVMHVEL